MIIAFDYDDTISFLDHKMFRKELEKNNLIKYSKMLQENVYLEYKGNHLPYLYNSNLLRCHPLELCTLNFGFSLVLKLLDEGYSFENADNFSKREVLNLFYRSKRRINGHDLKFLDYLIRNNNKIAIITMSNEEDISAEIKKRKIEIYDNVNKTYVNGNNYLNVYGLKIAVDRPYYKKVLNEINPDIVVGNSFSIDLSLPVFMNKKVFLVKNDCTLEIFKRYIEERGNCVINYIAELKRFL
ncbi:MAG: hypothetical protein QXG91_04140 [Candidatus Aenigmatarchaeota archaeon]